MSFPLSVKTVNWASHNMGKTICYRSKKRGQTCKVQKKWGKCALRGENKDSYAIGPIKNIVGIDIR